MRFVSCNVTWSVYNVDVVELNFNILMHVCMLLSDVLGILRANSYMLI